MYPYLKNSVVLVDGPGATGVYELMSGAFLRVSKDAGEVLRRLDGTTPTSALSLEEWQFVQEAMDEGIVAMGDDCQRRPQLALEDVVKRRRPLRFAWVELTSKCNQLCLHCFVGDELNRFPHVPKERLFHYADALSQQGARQVVLTGGEPTLHPDFEEVVEYFARYRFRLALLTNASRPGFLKQVECLLRNDVTIKIALLGWEATHDRMAGVPGCFAKTIHAIRYLKDLGATVQLGTTVTAVNHRDIPKIRAFADEMNLPLEVSPIYGVGWAKKNASTVLSLPMADVLQVCAEDASPTPKAANGPLVQLRRKRDTYEVDPVDYEAVDLRGFLTSQHECGQKIVAVLASGAVTPCLMLREDQHALGYTTNNTLEEILNGDTGERAAFDELMALDKVSGCRECEARFVCKAGGCSASAYALTGSVQNKNPLYDGCYYEESPQRLGDP